MRHQLTVYKQTGARPRLRPTDRLFWQQQRFRDHWRRLSEQGTPGRPVVAKEIRALIQDMWQANPTWGSPRIVGDLHKLGIDVAKSALLRNF